MSDEWRTIYSLKSFQSVIMEHEQYIAAKPEQMPRATYWPFVLAVSLLFLGWGLLTTWIIAVAGGIGIMVAITGWIKDLLYERRNDEREPQKLSD